MFRIAIGIVGLALFVSCATMSDVPAARSTSHPPAGCAPQSTLETQSSRRRIRPPASRGAFRSTSPESSRDASVFRSSSSPTTRRAR